MAIKGFGHARACEAVIKSGCITHTRHAGSAEWARANSPPASSCMTDYCDGIAGNSQQTKKGSGISSMVGRTLFGMGRMGMDRVA